MAQIKGYKKFKNAVDELKRITEEFEAVKGYLEEDEELPEESVTTFRDNIRPYIEMINNMAGDIDDKRSWLDDKSESYQEGDNGQEWDEHLTTLEEIKDEIEGIDVDSDDVDDIMSTIENLSDLD